MTPLTNPTTDTLMTAMEGEYAEITKHLINDPVDLSQVKFWRGQLFAYKSIAEMLGRDITLVPKQEGVKA